MFPFICTLLRNINQGKIVVKTGRPSTRRSRSTISVGGAAAVTGFYVFISYHVSQFR